jgi:soluble lytic murein transglycosylase-like protein
LGRVTTALAVAAMMLASAARAEPVDRWSAPIAEAAHRFGLPEDWVRRVIRIESGGNALSHGGPIMSSAGAMGLMQLMPATWRDMRSLLGLGPDPFEPRDNILAGTAYLRLMYDRFGYPGLFAAYNAGPGRYAAHLASGRELPAETRAYLAQATQAGGIAHGTNRLPSAAAPPQQRLFAVVARRAAESVRSAAASPAMWGGLFVQLRGSGAP